MKNNYIFILLFIISQQVFSQAPQKNWTLVDPLSGYLSFDYVARDYILMDDGFSYDALGVNHFSATINSHLVFPVDYETDPIYVDDRELDKSLPVGTTAGSHSVSLTGAANYNIPIVIPPGTAGMMPNLTISYSSQAGNGLLGMGWNLAGLSAITRAGQTYYHDGEKTGINLNGNDRFILDGSRLISVNGTYGSDGCEYYPEVFNGMKITSHGTVGNGPEKFIVETKDGKTIEYGISSNSRVKPGNTVITWLIEKVSDPYGNYVKFIYEGNDSEKRILEIEYTINDNNNLSAYNNIEFYYSERIDKNTVYVAGEALQQNVLLDKLIVRSENEIVRTYDLKYHYEFYSHLIEVVEMDSDGNHSNSTVFENYEKSDHFDDILFNETTIWDLSDYYFDFTGDGITDMMRVDYYNNEATYWKRENNSFGATPIATGGIFHTCDDIVPGDYNGDGLTDFVQFSIDEGDDRIKLHFSISNGGGGFDILDEVSFTIQDVSWQDGRYAYRTGDINGNGKSDFVVLYNPFSNVHNAWIKVFEVDDNDIPQIIAEHSRTYRRLYDNIHIGDFNGDGKDDIMTFEYANEQPCLIYSKVDNDNPILSEIYFGTNINQVH